MIVTSRPRLAAVVVAIGLASVSIPAHAQLTLTPAGVADGFTLVPFVSGYNFGGGITYGPLAQGILRTALLSPAASATERFTYLTMSTTRLWPAR